VSFYHVETGLLHDVMLTTSDESIIALNAPAGHIAIDGHHDSLSKRVNVETGEVVEYQPPAPSAEHVWHDETKRWRLSDGAQAKIDGRAAALARIAALVDSQHQFVREYLLGVAPALERLAAIHDEIGKLSADI
jgi:hypothetical protein